jgi:D-methionine transport system substrate-binding protein
MRKTLSALAFTTAATLTLAACGAGSGADDASAEETSDGVTTVTIGASPVPHAEILEFVQENLAADAGLDLKIVTFDDYVLPNTSLAEGDLDANYFQHLPYFESQVEAQGFEFDHFDGVHIEPLGIYSENLDSLADVPDGAKVGITNDPGNQARALDLLVDNGLLTLEDVGDALPTLLDIAENPKNLELIETAPEQLVRALPDVDLAVINGNFALEAELNPAEDALVLESGEDNPYANFIAVRAEDKDDEALVKLNELLHTPEVAVFIEERWPSGEVVAAF